MAIAKNTARTANSTGGTTITVTSVNCTGSDRVLIAVVCTYTSTTSPTGVTFNGSESFTKLAEHTTSPSGGEQPFRVSYWALTAPTSTTASVVATFAASTDNACVMTQCFTGVDQSTPYGTAATATETLNAGGANPSLTIGSTATGELSVVGMALGRLTGDTAKTPGTDVTAEINGSVNTYMGYALWTKPGTTTSTTVDGTLTTATSWRMTGVSLKPVSGGGGTSIPVIRHHLQQQGIA